MLKTATAINSFGSEPSKADFVPTSEPLVTLTIGQLQDLVTQAAEKAIQPLHDVIESLKVTVARQDEKIAALESAQETQADNSLIQLRLINDLREATKKEAQPLQKDRGEILRALLAANGGKMLSTDARKKMHLSRSRFSELLTTAKDEIEVKPYHLSQKLEGLGPKMNVPRNMEH